MENLASLHPAAQVAVIVMFGLVSMTFIYAMFKSL
jgi:hypothetical protein